MDDLRELNGLRPLLRGLDRGQRAELRDYFHQMRLLGPAEFAAVFGVLVEAVDRVQSDEDYLIRRLREDWWSDVVAGIEQTQRAGPA